MTETFQLPKYSNKGMKCKHSIKNGTLYETDWLNCFCCTVCERHFTMKGHKPWKVGFDKSGPYIGAKA